MKPFIVFFLIASLLLAFLLIYLGNDFLNVISLLSQWLALSVVGVSLGSIDNFSNAAALENNKVNLSDIIINPFHSLEKLKFVSGSRVISIILFGTLVFGTTNAYIIVEKLDIDKNTDNFIKSISFASLGVSQFGGWFFQAGLIYMFSIVLGGKLEFNIRPPAKVGIVKQRTNLHLQESQLA